MCSSKQASVVISFQIQYFTGILVEEVKDGMVVISFQIQYFTGAATN